MSDETKKPGYDEETLARVLEAAFVLQEHQQELQALKKEIELKQKLAQTESHSIPAGQEPAALSSAAAPDSETVPVSSGAIPPVEHTEEEDQSLDGSSVGESFGQEQQPSMLAKVMDTQRGIKEQGLSPQRALTEIAEQLIDLSSAAGAAVAVINDSKIRYRATAGFRTPPIESEMSSDHALCAPCLRRGQVFRCADVNPEFVIETAECRRRGIGSFIAVPVMMNDRVAGAVELYYSDPRAFTEQDVETCQLMAGLISEVLAHEEAASPKTTLDKSADPLIPAIPSARTGAAPQPVERAEPHACYKCGHALIGEEQFCGQCGAPRTTADAVPVSLQSKVASLWHMQESSKKEDGDEKLPPERAINDSLSANRVSIARATQLLTTEASSPADPHDSSEVETANIAGSDWSHKEVPPAIPVHAQLATTHDEASEQEDMNGESKPALTSDWSSAGSALDFLERLGTNRQGNLQRLWNTRRGDIYLAISVILVGCVILWAVGGTHGPKPAPAQPSATQPAATQPATQTQRKAAQPELPLLERMMIAVGLAEAPEPPPDRGNPTTQVWVDLRTALYYCPGSDLYGKTPKGKYASQREAQLDQFEPAYRKNCN